MRELIIRNVSPTSLSATLEKMATVVDPVCGIVKSVLPNWLEEGDARIFAFGAVASQGSPLAKGPQVVHAGGAALNRDQAIAATIGEAIERFCAAYADPDDQVFGAYND